MSGSFVKNCLDGILNSPIVKAFFKPLVNGIKLEKRNFEHDNVPISDNNDNKVQYVQEISQKSKHRRILCDGDVSNENLLIKNNKNEEKESNLTINSFKKQNERRTIKIENKRQSLWLNSNSLKNSLNDNKNNNKNKQVNIQTDLFSIKKDVIKCDLNIFYPGKTVFGGTSSINTFSLPRKASIIQYNTNHTSCNTLSPPNLEKSNIISTLSKKPSDSTNSYVSTKIQKILEESENTMNSSIIINEKSHIFKFEPCNVFEDNKLKFNDKNCDPFDFLNNNNGQFRIKSNVSTYKCPDVPEKDPYNRSFEVPPDNSIIFDKIEQPKLPLHLIQLHPVQNSTEHLTTVKLTENKINEHHLVETNFSENNNFQSKGFSNPIILYHGNVVDSNLKYVFSSPSYLEEDTKNQTAQSDLINKTMIEENMPEINAKNLIETFGKTIIPANKNDHLYDFSSPIELNQDENPVNSSSSLIPINFSFSDPIN